LRSWDLQVILDRGLVGDRDISLIAEGLIAGGARAIQYRAKGLRDNAFIEDAKRLRELIKPGQCSLIINDRADIALTVGADGVHLGQDDMPYSEARELLGREKLIGISTHSAAQAVEAEAIGADYIGVGPIFKTSTKPDLEPIGIDVVREVAAKVKITTLFIGGIDLENIDEVLAAGGNAVAVASAILNSKNIATTTKKFIDRITK